MRLRWLVPACCAIALAACQAHCNGFVLDSEVPAGPEGFSVALFQTTGVGLVPGHAVALANNGAVFDQLERDFDSASRSINVVHYIWNPGGPSPRLIEALGRAHQRGVVCRVLVDATGSLRFVPSGVGAALEAAGCEVRIFRRLDGRITVERNHRKIVVVDGRVGYTGGFCIDGRWLGDGVSAGQWRETNVRVEGPAVAQMQQAFAENWQEAGGALLPTEDFPEAALAGTARAGFVTSTASKNVTRAERLVTLLCHAATRRLWIANAYFVPSPQFSDCLVKKAKVGVDVQLLVPGEANDQPHLTVQQRARYDRLLKGGVRIFEYQPTMMHAKTFIVDDHLAAIGSINLLKVSLVSLEEGVLVADDPALVAAMVADWQRDIRHSNEVGSSFPR